MSEQLNLKLNNVRLVQFKTLNNPNNINNFYRFSESSNNNKYINTWTS